MFKEEDKLKIEKVNEHNGDLSDFYNYMMIDGRVRIGVYNKRLIHIGERMVIDPKDFPQCTRQDIIDINNAIIEEKEDRLTKYLESVGFKNYYKILKHLDLVDCIIPCVYLDFKDFLKRKPKNFENTNYVLQRVYEENPFYCDIENEELRGITIEDWNIKKFLSTAQLCNCNNKHVKAFKTLLSEE